MLKTMKKPLSLIVCAVLLLFSVPFSASAASPYNYTLDSDNNAIITGAETGTTVNTIPSEIDGHSVTAIADYAFSEPSSKGIIFGTTLALPDTLISIGEGAFQYNTTITDVTIPESVTKIGKFAFFSCIKLKTVTINGTPTEIPLGAFRNCHLLSSVNIPESVTVIGESAFAYDYSMTSISIPYSVESIGKNAFLNCYSLVDATVYSSDCRYSTNVFDIVASKFVLTGYSGSTTNQYALDNSLTFAALPDIKGRETLEKFVSDYKGLIDSQSLYCFASTLVNDFSQAYSDTCKILRNPAGYASSTVQNIVDKASGFTLTAHDYSLVSSSPGDNQSGSIYYKCSNCSACVGAAMDSTGELSPTESEDEVLTVPSPILCEFTIPGYDYSRHSASLKIDENANSQLIRFPASLKIPEGAQVSDFGFVYTQTRYLNNITEPMDNNNYGIEYFHVGRNMVYKYSVMKSGGSYTVHDSDTYTFNLVINVSDTNWNRHYAARAFITYTYHGLEFTVYDNVYASRSIKWMAQQIVASPYESETTKEYFQNKILS